MKVEILDSDLSTLVEHLEVRGLKADSLLMDHIHKINWRLKESAKKINADNNISPFFDMRDFDGKIEPMD